MNLENFPYYISKITGVHAFTINWCDWLDVGMSVKTYMRENKTKDINLVNSSISDGIYPSEGVNIFHKCLQSKSHVSTIYNKNILEVINYYRIEYDKITNPYISSIGLIEDSNESKNNLEENLIEIFSHFFGKEDIAPNDDFFELGGDSLKAMTLIARINQKIGVNLSIGDIYKYPTIKELINKLLKGSLNSETKEIPKASLKKYYPLSPTQRRMYFLQMLDKQSTAYNEVKLFWIVGVLDKNKLEVAFEQLIKRHESLRTAFIFRMNCPDNLY